MRYMQLTAFLFEYLLFKKNSNDSYLKKKHLFLCLIKMCASLDNILHKAIERGGVCQPILNTWL